MFNQPFIIPAILLLILSLPLILGLIPRQWAIGIRTPKTLSDDDIWLQANRFGGLAILISSLVYLVVAGILPCTAPCGINFEQWLLHVGAFGLPLLVSLLLIRWYVESL